MENISTRLAQYTAALLLIALLVAATAYAAARPRQLGVREVGAVVGAPVTTNPAVKVPSVQQLTAGFPALTSARRVAATDDTSTVKWIDGAMQSTYDYSCFSGSWGPLTSESVGYMGNEDVTSPRVGEVYYIRALVGGVGQPCAGPYANIEFLLPAFTDFAIDANNKVHCFSGPIDTWEIIEVPAADCPQATYPGVYGWVFNTANGEPWNVMGNVVIVAVPVISTKKMSGLATNSWLYGAIQGVDGLNDPWDNPRQGVFVADSAPHITYDDPATTKITSASAHAHGYVYNLFQPGKAYFEFGPTTAYGQRTDYFDIGSDYNYYTMDTDFVSLKPGTTYHWRLRFTTSSSQLVNGADQTFTTKSADEPGSLELSANRIAFGEVKVGATSDPEEVEVTNTGAAAIAITSISITGTRASDYKQTGNCRTSLPAGASCTIKVTFKPGSTGSRPARLQIKSDAATGQINVTLSGTGVDE